MSNYIKLSKGLFKNFLRIFLEILSCLVGLFIKPERNNRFSIDDKILLKSALELGKCIRARELTSEKVVEVYITQAKQVNKTINAIVEDHFEQAIKRARGIDMQIASMTADELTELAKTKPLFGVPFSIKESVALKDGSYTCGIAARATKRASESNSAIKKLVDSGLIPLASTNTPCMNLWFDSYNLLHGRTNNPYDRSRIPGGSSGGEAALIASAGSVVGVGSDLAGSIRIPSNFCGIFGHKPTPFTVPTDNSYPACHGDREWLRGVGPMTRYACDLLPMLKLMVTSEARTKLRLEEPVDLSKIKLFYCEDIGDPLSSSCSHDILAGLRASIEHLTSKYDVSATKITLTGFNYGLPLWSAVADGGQDYAPEHPDGFIRFNPFVELVKCLLGTSAFPFNAIFCALIEKIGAKNGSAKQEYLKKVAEKMREEFETQLGENGVLLMPAHPTPAPHHYTTIFKFLNCSYTAVVNALFAPVTQCPLGMSREGLPIGVQLITKQYNDRLTLALARDLEVSFGGWIPPVKTSCI